MTDTSITTGTIEHVDPTTVIVEANVRTIAPLDKEFLASIRENGVLTPIYARRDQEGNVIVRAGQRRTLAAREVGLPTIPAYIVDGSDAIADRIVQQLVENEHRTDLTDGDRAAAFQQLAFEGLTPQVIAKRTATKKAKVEQGLKVADNAFATKTIVEHQLTLDQAAALIEFEGADDTVSELIKVATTEPEQFAHATQRARDERTRAQEVARVSVELREQGFTILDRDPGYYSDEYTALGDLTKDGIRLTVQDLADVTDKFAYVRSYYGGEAEPVFYLTDFKAAGFRKGSSSGSAAGPMSDEEKAERRELIANNKAWASAEVVRREWLTTFLSRKTFPKDVATFTALGLTARRTIVADGMSRGNSLAHTLLGVEHEGGMWATDKLADQITTNPGKATQVMLAVVIGGIEAHTDRTTWRNPTKQAADYFTQLAAWGYALSDVEQIVLAQKSDASDAGEADGEPEGVEEVIPEDAE